MRIKWALDKDQMSHCSDCWDRDYDWPDKLGLGQGAFSLSIEAGPCLAETLWSVNRNDLKPAGPVQVILLIPVIPATWRSGRVGKDVKGSISQIFPKITKNLFVSFCFTFCYSIWGPAHRAWAPKAPSLSRHLEELKLDRDSGNCELQWMAPWAFPQRRSKPARSVPVLGHRIGYCSLQSALWCLCNVLWAHHTLTAAFLQEFPDHDQASREKNPSNLHEEMRWGMGFFFKHANMCRDPRKIPVQQFNLKSLSNCELRAMSRRCSKPLS